MVYIADGAKLVGDIHFGDDCSVWYNAVLRGDSGSLTFGKRVNIQDNCTVHSGKGYVVQVGDDVTVGHNAILHGCKIGSHVLVGMGAIVMNGAVIHDHTILAAGALVSENKEYKEGVLLMGVPAKVVRKLTEAEMADIDHNAQAYVMLAKQELEERK